MNLLYISEDYLNSKVHHQLCNALTDCDESMQITLFSVKRKGVSFKDITSQFVIQKYHPVVAELSDSHFLYKFVFPYKVRKKWELLLQNVDLFQIHHVHAATLFSEGAIAYRCWKYYGIPYSVAIRGADINFYLKKMPHLWALGRKIIQHAQKVVFISPSQELSAYLAAPLNRIHANLKEKSVVIPNGLDPFWLQHRVGKHSVQPSKILYVGRFDQNKNVEMLIDAVTTARIQKPNLELHLVGTGGEHEKSVLDKVNQHPDFMFYHGPIYELPALQQRFKEADLFAMISHSETFGLVFVEALTQGLPILYTKGQGIDGVFEDLQVGVATTLDATETVANALVQLVDQAQSYQKNIATIDFKPFHWETIASQYINFMNNPKVNPIVEKDEKEDLPFITVICPVYNEKKYISACIESVIQSDYPKDLMELYFIDGMSPDGTASIIKEYSEKYPYIKLLENPHKTVPYALNLAIDQSIGDLIIRLDAHAIYPKNYFLDLVKWQMKLDADNVGGLCRTLPAQKTPVAHAIAEAVSSKFGMGNAYFRIGTSQVRKVDTVPFGCFKRDLFERIGKFDVELTRNQDDEFNGRIVKNGGSVYLIPHIVSDYYARDTIRKVSQMFYQYGLFKPLVNKKLGSPATLRQFAPPVFVLGLFFGLILSFVSHVFMIPFVVIMAVYLFTALDYGRKAGNKWGDWKLVLWMPIVYFVIHVSYGWGYLRGFYKVLTGRSFQVKSNR